MACWVVHVCPSVRARCKAESSGSPDIRTCSRRVVISPAIHSPRGSPPYVAVNAASVAVGHSATSDGWGFRVGPRYTPRGRG